MILEMAADGHADRVAIGPLDRGVTFAELARMSRRAGTFLSLVSGDRVALVDENSLALPVGLFGAVIAGKPFVPVNYRLSDDKLRALVARTAPSVVVVGAGVEARLGPVDGVDLVSREDLLAAAGDESIAERDGWGCDPDGVAALLFTSGTTGEPKVAMLRHRNLASYVTASVEFGSAGEDECTLVSVPPYHVAAVAAVLSNVYAGRRVVQMERFDAHQWVELVRREGATNTMVLPTMLNRILDELDADGAALASMRAIAYGGGPMPRPVVERALRLLPDVDFVNAYGLTETSSTISILGPADHREAYNSIDPAIRARLGSVGRPLPAVEVSIRDGDGAELPVGEAGQIWVRGEQVSGEYLGFERTDPDHGDGWFDTRDSGRLDAAGFLYVQGRLDDVIVRGGENLAPGEIEGVLLEHPAVSEAAVVGIPNVEWGESVTAAVVLKPGADTTEEELRLHVRSALRSARTPERILFFGQLPYSDTGKLLRRVVRDELAAGLSDS
jgi:acyl-CoA synthetase (AMP-forming)/AMP-acid ligase II